MDELNKRLKKMRDNANNPNPVTAYIATQMYRDVMDHFDKEMGPQSKWKQLSPITIENRRKGKGRGSDKILQDTGLLRASIKPNNTKDSASVGTNLNYAEKHQYGYKNIPQRKFLWLSKAVLDLITKKVGKFYIAEE